MKYSYSKLRFYDGCPHAYEKVYLEGIPREQYEGQNTGKELHEKTEPYLKRLIRLNLQTDWEWAAAQTQKSTTEEVAEVWEKFYNSFSLPTPIQDPVVEKKLAFTRSWQPCDFDSPKAFFRMVIDLTFRQNFLVVVRDWKSNWRMPESVEKDLQLRTYGWGACRALYPEVQEVLLQLYFLRYGKIRQVMLTPADLKGVPEELDRKIAKIEADRHFEPRPGSFCDECGVAPHCTYISKALVPREFIAPTTLEEAQKAAVQLLALRRMAKTLTAHVKNWSELSGPISVGDMVYGPSFSDSLDAKAVVDALLGENLQREAIWPLLSVKKTPLESLLKKLKKKELLNSVMRMTVGDPGVRFDFRKAEKEKPFSRQGKLTSDPEKQAA